MNYSVKLFSIELLYTSQYNLFVHIKKKTSCSYHKHKINIFVFQKFIKI